MNREQIASELLRGCPTESRRDHERIADAIRRKNSLYEILSMPEMALWPETYVWLKRELSAIEGILKYQITAPTVPGATPVVQGAYATLRAARNRAQEFSHRRDLAICDVRIERMNGQLVEYAGPSR